MIETLSQLVACVESNNVPWAMRHEPGYARYVTPAIVDKIKRAHRPAFMNTDTAEVIGRTSFGLYQIMGGNLYDLGLPLPISAFMADKALQLQYFDKYCASRKIGQYTLTDILTDKKKREDFARKYNGDGPTYGARLLTVYNQSQR